jgi:hypothetical protein
VAMVESFISPKLSGAGYLLKRKGGLQAKDSGNDLALSGQPSHFDNPRAPGA